MPLPARQQRPRSFARRGTVVVEAAIVLPTYLALLWGVIEIRRAQLVINLPHTTCRAGARLVWTEGTSSSNVVTKVTQSLGSAIKTNKASAYIVYIKDASAYDSSSVPLTSDARVESLPSLEAKNAQLRRMFVVRAKVANNDVAIESVPFFRGVVLDAVSFMRREPPTRLLREAFSHARKTSTLA